LISGFSSAKSAPKKKKKKKENVKVPFLKNRDDSSVGDMGTIFALLLTMPAAC
jgi:hypothetical protein